METMETPNTALIGARKQLRENHLRSVAQSIEDFLDFVADRESFLQNLTKVVPGTGLLQHVVERVDEIKNTHFRQRHVFVDLDAQVRAAPRKNVGLLLFALGNLTLIYAYGTGGKAAIVTPLASLYSLVTIPLAVVLLHERISGREGLGIALAILAAVALAWESPASETPIPPAQR